MESPTSLTHGAYAELRSQLLACHFAPGEKLKIDDLCRRFAVGSSAVREALSRLASEGFVVSEPQRGFRVAPLSIDALRDLTHVRCSIESLCLRGAIEKGGVEWQSQVVAALHRLTHTPVWADKATRRYSDEYAKAHEIFMKSSPRDAAVPGSFICERSFSITPNAIAGFPARCRKWTGTLTRNIAKLWMPLCRETANARSR